VIANHDANLGLAASDIADSEADPLDHVENGVAAPSQA
jgi:hypothetical protein